MSDGTPFHFRAGRCVCTAAESCESFAARMGRQELDGFEQAWTARQTDMMLAGIPPEFGHGVHWQEGVPAIQHYARYGAREDDLI